MQKKAQSVPTIPQGQPSKGAPGASTRLKAERVQLQIKELPGWRLHAGGRAIARSFELPSTQSAVAFLQLVAELGRARGSVPQVAVGSGKATVTLWSPKPGWLTAEDFELASTLKFRG